MRSGTCIKKNTMPLKVCKQNVVYTQKCVNKVDEHRGGGQRVNVVLIYHEYYFQDSPNKQASMLKDFSQMAVTPYLGRRIELSLSCQCGEKP